MAMKPKHTKEQIVRLVKRHGYDGKKILAATGWSRKRLAHRLMFWGLRLTPPLNLHSDRELNHLIAMCNSHIELRRRLRLTREKYRTSLKRRGMYPNYPRYKRQARQIPTPVLERIFKESAYSVKRTAEQLGFCQKTMQKELRRRGIGTNRGRTIYPWDKWELEQLHHVQGCNTWDIAELYGCTDRGVRFAMQRYGVEIINNKRDGRPKPTERPRRPLTDHAWDASPLENNGQ